MSYLTLTIDGGDEVRVYQYVDGTISDRFDCPACDSTDGAKMDGTGVWACDDCDASGTCDHSSNSLATVTEDGLGLHGHTQREIEVYVCNWCGSTNDTITPAEERNELQLQNQTMEILQK